MHGGNMEIRNRIKELRMVKASDILANPKNWRKHSATQAKVLQNMLGEIGYADALIAYETDEGLMLIDGHLRAETTPELDVPVLVTDLDEAEADKLLATLDPISSMAVSDKNALNVLMDSIKNQNETFRNVLNRIKEKSEFETEYLSPEVLKRHPNNYVEHPEEQLEHLVESIKQFGLYKNIVIASDDTILAGHGIVEAARKLRLETVPVIRLDILPNDPKALKLLAGDNEIGNLAEIDDRSLTEMLRNIKDQTDNGLIGTGYTDQHLANMVMVTRPMSEIEDFDAAQEWIGLPEFEYSSHTERVQLTIYFDLEMDREDLIMQIGSIYPNFKPIHTTQRAWNAWYPPREQDDAASVKFEVNIDNDFMIDNEDNE